MMKKILIILSLISILLLAGCNAVSRQFGGTVNITLDKGQKLTNITWKENSLWILTKPMTDKDVIETYTFKEDSNFGILNGKVIIKEQK